MEWTYDPTQYSERSYTPIPIGDHRVRIDDVTEKIFKSGNSGYELTLAVSGYNRKLWYYLVLDPSNPSQTNQRLGEFFDCFEITNFAMGTGKQWIGQVGAVRVKHETYEGAPTDKVQYLLKRERQDRLPPWEEPNGNKWTKVANHDTGWADLPPDTQLPF